MARALRWQRRGDRFESGILHKNTVLQKVIRYFILNIFSRENLFITMEEDKKSINSFLSVIQATFLAVFFLTVYFLITTSKNHPITFGLFLNPFVIGALFYFSMANFIFSSIFQYLRRQFPTLLYILFFFFCLWALLFILSYSAERKYDNQIPDIMDGVSESITLLLIKVSFFSIISNFLVILKSWYFMKRESSLTDSEF